MANAQLSVMIIVGLVIVAMVGVGYYIVNANQEAQAQTNVKGVQSSREVVTPVREFVDGCLRAAATDAIDTIGKQGGVLFESQGGLTPDALQQEGVMTMVYDGHPVWYVLDPPQGTVFSTDGTPLYYADAPDYPWPTFPYPSATDWSHQYFYGFYGIEHVPTLNGSASKTIEKQLAAAVASGTDACFGGWSKLSYLPVKITSPKSDIKVSFDEGDTTFTLNTSILIERTDGTGQSTISSSIVKLPVRLKAIWQAAKYVIAEDAKNITYDPSTYANDGIVASVKQDVNPAYVGEDLITFTDTIGKLEGVPFEFRVMRHDRPPALFYVAQPAGAGYINLCQGAQIERLGDRMAFNTSGCTGAGGIVSQGGVDIYLWPMTDTIKALDPDEDATHITIMVGGQPLEEEVWRTVPYPFITKTSGPFGKVLDIQIGAYEDGKGPQPQDWQDLEMPATATQEGTV